MCVSLGADVGRCLVQSFGRGRGGISGGIELGKTGTAWVVLEYFIIFQMVLTWVGCV